MFNPIQWQDWYKVKLSSIVLPGVATDEIEYYFDVTEPVSVEQFVVYIDFQDIIKKDIIEIHRTSLWWTRLHYYQYNRSNPTVRHWVDAFVQINSMAAYWNILSKNVDSFWWIRKLINPWLKIKVYWWRISHPVLWDYDIQSSIITLSDNTTSYIYFNDDNSQFEISGTEPSAYFVLWIITTLSWDITNISDNRANYILNWIPASITESQRDALVWIRNWVIIFNTTSWLLQYYAWWTWYNVPISWWTDPTPRLSEIVEGKTSWSSDSEINEWINYRWETPLVPKPSQIKNIKDFIISWESVLSNSDYYCWENWNKWDSLFTETWPTFAQATSILNIWDCIWTTRLWIKLLWTNISSNTLKLSLAKNWNPTAFLRVRIETDNAWQPSWSLIDDNATIDINPSTLTASLVDTTITFPWIISISNFSFCHLVLSIVWGIIDVNNYYKIWYNTNNSSIRKSLSYNGSSWINWQLDENTTTISVALSATTSSTSTYWQRIMSNINWFLKHIVKSPTCTATKAYLKNSWWTILATATFSWNIASFCYNLTAWTTYRIECWSDGVSYTVHYVVWSFPQNTANINILSWSIGWIDWSAVSLHSNIVDIVTWTYEEHFMYVSSVLFHNKLLSKTDARFSYKLPDIPRIATDNYVIWDIIKYDYKWITKQFSWLTINTPYFVSNTPWELSTTAWTNICVLWKAFYENWLYLFLSKKNNIFDCTKTQSPSWTWTSNSASFFADWIYSVLLECRWETTRWWWNCYLQISEDNVNRYNLYSLYNFNDSDWGNEKIFNQFVIHPWYYYRWFVSASATAWDTTTMTIITKSISMI